MGQTLVIVPCGLAKVWSKSPEAGPTAASQAYDGGPFKVNRRYAERFADRWVILSAKYGFIPPDFVIPGPYNVTFKRKNPTPIGVGTLREQIGTQGLFRFDPVIVLGGKEYQAIVREAFAPWETRLLSPFAGLPIGKAMQAVNRAIERGDPITAPAKEP